MDFIEISKKRKSVRKYSNRPVEKEKLDKVLEAGRWAPTAVNGQPQRILVLDTQEELEKVREVSTFERDEKYIKLAKECEDKKENKNSYYYGAPLVLMICYDKNSCWKHPTSNKSSGETDAVIVTTHMMMEAASLDIGTVWVSYFDIDKARKLFKIPESYEPLCMLNLGYPFEDDTFDNSHKGNRKPISETVFYHEFN